MPNPWGIPSERGNQICFNFDCSPDCRNKGFKDVRTHSGTLQNGQEAEKTGKTTLGVKGVTWFSACPKFDVIGGITIDYMHTACLGVTKLLINFWTGSAFKNSAFSVYIYISLPELDKGI